MNITDDPMPGVAPTGTPSIMALGVKGNEQIVLTTYLKDMDFAKRYAQGMASQYDEIIIIQTVLAYRVWDRDCDNAKRAGAAA